MRAYMAPFALVLLYWVTAWLVPLGVGWGVGTTVTGLWD